MDENKPGSHLRHLSLTYLRRDFSPGQWKKRRGKRRVPRCRIRRYTRQCHSRFQIYCQRQPYLHYCTPRACRRVYAPCLQGIHRPYQAHHVARQQESRRMETDRRRTTNQPYPTPFRRFSCLCAAGRNASRINTLSYIKFLLPVLTAYPTRLVIKSKNRL